MNSEFGPVFLLGGILCLAVARYVDFQRADQHPLWQWATRPYAFLDSKWIAGGRRRYFYLMGGLFVVIGILGLFARPSDGSPAQPASGAATSCVYLTDHTGARYSLSYAHQACDREGYRPLPLDQFDSAESWAFNAGDAGFLPRLSEYRISARLATLDDRSDRGWSPHSGFWAEYQWAEHTSDAYLTALDALGHTPLIESAFEGPFLRLRLANKSSLFYEMKQRRLSQSERTELLQLLVDAEDSLSHQPKMLLIHNTLDSAVRAVHGYEAARRKTFSEYHLDE